MEGLNCKNQDCGLKIWSWSVRILLVRFGYIQDKIQPFILVSSDVSTENSQLVRHAILKYHITLVVFAIFYAKSILDKSQF